MRATLICAVPQEEHALARSWLAAPTLGLLAALAAASARPERAPPAAPHEWRFAFAGPLTGPLALSAQESLAGVKCALARLAAPLPAPLIVLDDGDDPKKAEAAFEAAKKQKADVVIAAATGATVEAYVAKARKDGMPLLLVGACGPGKPSIAAEEPVFWLGAWPVEQAITIGTFLDIPCHSRKTGLVVEQTARGKELAEALARNLAGGASGGRMQLVAAVFVAPHGRLLPEWVAELKTAGADRLVVSGEPDLLDATIDALDAAGWKVPLFVDEPLLSAAATKLHAPGAAEKLKDAFLLQGAPRFAEKPSPELVSAWSATSPGSTEIPLRAQRAFTTTSLFLRAVGQPPKKPKLAEIVASLLDQAYGEEENGRPLLDETHRSARMIWLPWKLGEKGLEPDDPRLYFDPDMGPPLRVRSPLLYQVEPGTKVVWFSYGDATSKAVRSIEQDLTELGLITRGYDGQMDRWVEDELMARTLGKLNKLFLKNEDGTFIPGVSFAVSFTTEKPAQLKESDYWRAVIAGDDPEAGGRAWPGEGRCEIYSTFMVRTIYKPKALVPPLSGADRKYLDGKYAWGSSSEENMRVKLLRALIDGYAQSFALTGAHELGHVAGLGHDTECPRSIMNVVEGAGLAMTSACWIPSHVEVLEKSLGRYGVPGKKRDRER
jgi:ABC-type branched-subunit amino acid transport system substrate-binding protein